MVKISKEEFLKQFPNVTISEDYVWPSGAWISVKERLPNNKEIVIAINEEGEMAICKFEKTEWEYFFMLNMTSYQLKKVTHWMPLPEMPK